MFDCHLFRLNADMERDLYSASNIRCAEEDVPGTNLIQNQFIAMTFDIRKIFCHDIYYEMEELNVPAHR